MLKYAAADTSVLSSVAIASTGSGDRVTAELALLDLLNANPDHVEGSYSMAVLRQHQGNDAGTH